MNAGIINAQCAYQISTFWRVTGIESKAMRAEWRKLGLPVLAPFGDNKKQQWIRGSDFLEWLEQLAAAPEPD